MEEIFTLDYTYLLSLAIILFSTKVFGFLTEKIKLPQVVGDIVPLFSWNQKYNYKRGLELKESKKNHR